MTTPPLAALLDLVASEASGEFVCVTSSVELHVYLQAGRIAWATDSTRPFAFSRYLLEHTSITKETFKEVLESCRRDRLPLGETLVEWQVATLEEIRAALRHQIEGALRSLVDSATGRTIFLERQRQFASYDAALTFEARELIPLPSVVHVQEAPGIVARLRGELPAAAWLELLEGAVVREQQPIAEGPLTPIDVVTHTILDGADLVALRTGRGTILGAALPEQRRSLWCRLDVETAFGTTLSTLAQLGRLHPPSTPVPPPAEPRGRGLQVRDVGELDSRNSAAIRTFMERAPEIDAVFLIDRRGPSGGAIRRGLDAEPLLATVRRREPVLDVLLADDGAAPANLEDLGYRLRSVVTGEKEWWCFGAELGSEPARTLWLFLERSNAQGLGWAYLTSLTGQLSLVPRSAEHG